MKHWRKPLGQTQPKATRYQVRILEDRCKGCRFCIEFCPRQVLHESGDFNKKGYHPACADAGDGCLNCGLCERICPEFAVHVAPAGEATND